MKTRAKSLVVLAFLGLIFTLIVFAAILFFALPNTEWISAGAAAGYPPSESPYPLRDTSTPLIYVVNIRGDFIALSGKDPHPVGQNVNWIPRENRFIDPVTGSNYFLDGSFDPKFLPDGPEPMNLHRYPVKIEGGILWIDISK